MIPLAVPEDIIPARNSTRKRQQAPRPPSSQNVRPYVKYAPLKREDLIRSWRESGHPPGGLVGAPGGASSGGQDAVSEYLLTVKVSGWPPVEQISHTPSTRLTV